MNKIEVEFRVKIPISDFEKSFQKISDYSVVKNRKKRFSIMMFVESNDDLSILYLRTTVDLEKNLYHTEIVHKKGKQHAKDRSEVSQEIDESLFEDYAKLLGTLSTQKTLIMQRETVNFETKDGIIISLVKAVHHAYIEFEILCDEIEKEIHEKRLLDFIYSLQMIPLNEEESMRFFKTLDEKDDRLISGTIDDISSVLAEYQKFRG